MEDFIKTTSDLDLMIANKKEQVAYAEQEYLRFKKMIVAETYTVDQLAKRKFELEGMVSDKEEEYEKATESLSKISKENNDQLLELNKNKEELKKVISSKEEILKDISDKKKYAEDLKSTYEEKYTTLAKNTEYHDIRVKEFETKVARLKEVISTF